LLASEVRELTNELRLAGNLDHYLDDELPDPAAAEMELICVGAGCAAVRSALQLKRTTHAVQRFAPRRSIHLKARRKDRHRRQRQI
jgi:hypothetical protein